MVSFKAIRLARFSACLLSLSTVAAFVMLQPPVVQAQTPPEETLEQSQDPAAIPEDPAVTDDLRPLAQDGSILSIPGGQRLMQEATDAVAAQDYDLAVQRLQEARQVFNQLSNFYQELSASFSGIDNRIAEEQRNLAVETAQMRDQATYQLALVHRAQNKPELAVPLLIQIIRSQNPTRELGQQAYQQLFELGFVDSPYPRDADEEPTSAIPSSGISQ
ncbi:MAG: hypothetical protein HC769_07050 [Cyanobacteria bacterium CRU_2_1]|nr:hypothetical protein [Cyanobacteria bacterium RU_5_0]NJR58631.1 hypothetical protein [Cyanobacteria bacterium CRU_2_1]